MESHHYDGGVNRGRKGLVLLKKNRTCKLGAHLTAGGTVSNRSAHRDAAARRCVTESAATLATNDCHQSEIDPGTSKVAALRRPLLRLACVH